MHRMQEKYSGRQEGTGNSQAHEHSPEQERAEHVEQQIVEVISEGIQPPKRVLDPKAGVNHPLTRLVTRLRKTGKR